jgi:hypothetical protein
MHQNEYYKISLRKLCVSELIFFENFFFIFFLMPRFKDKECTVEQFLKLKKNLRKKIIIN